ncbi:10454_t:CDS:2 [Acaulospora morrowiae]|uniref:10454_t:CDS:1 n=1 Tax=Acaulospora morrowiae TaxID=94023 RepID=A0A9N9FEQ6_9GLOM|nr:10454_t:CDS:2 [Acaulospora morrowiae]
MDVNELLAFTPSNESYESSDFPEPIERATRLLSASSYPTHGDVQASSECNSSKVRRILADIR